MSQFNLINIGTLQSNTVSGTGNKTLSNEEIVSLCDGNTTASGVIVSGTDILWLDIDLGFRVQVDDINLFIYVSGDRAAALANVDFYYKNTITDSYILCAKNYDTDKFYASGLPVLCAPQYIRVIVTNQEALIYEVEVLNDDTQVSFGETGNETLLILDHAVDGYNELGIFNNSPIGSKPANAYVMVDYSGEDSDYYIKLASSATGTYYGLEDGVTLKNNDLTQTYTWNMGEFDNISVNSNGNLINTYSNTGKYTTPIFDISDKFNTTFLLTKSTLHDGSTITAQIRSSDEDPLPFNKLVWFWKSPTTSNAYIYIGDMTSGYGDTMYYNVWNSTSALPAAVKFDRNNGDVVLLYKDTSEQYKLSRYDYVTKESYSSSYSNLNNISTFWDIDSDGCVWGYVKQSGFRIVRFDYNFTTRTTIKEESSLDFLSGLSATKNYTTCWYTNNSQNLLEHVNSDGSSLVSITVNSPSYVTSLPDGGCWVVSVGDSKLIQYSYYGTEQRSITYSSITTVNALKFGVHSSLQPFDDLCLWLLLDSQRVVQIDFEGNTISETYISNASNIDPFSGGCLVYCTSTKITYQLNGSGSIVYVWDFHTYTYGAGRPYPVTIYYDEFVTMGNITKLLPLSNDPHWSFDTGWKDISFSGCKLPMFRYHQVKFEFLPNISQVTLINPDAEYGNSTGWVSETHSIGTTSSIVYSGVYSFISEVDSSGSGYKINGYQRINLDTVNIDLIPGTTVFYASCYMSGNSSTTTYNVQSLGLALRFRDATIDYPATISTVYGPTLVATIEHAYYFTTVLATLPANAQYIEVCPWFIYVNPYNYMHFDNVRLYAFNPPELKSIVIPEPVIIRDLQPQEFKNVYIKKEIPADVPYKEYETRLKCWWGNEEG